MIASSQAIFSTTKVICTILNTQSSLANAHQLIRAVLETQPSLADTVLALLPIPSSLP
ncbi:hypothetical protein PtB15_5B294 [Puccinia triticina]|nr:hypothetical protein PtB15_5B294 [Puccinia triticina]